MTVIRVPIWGDDRVELARKGFLTVAARAIVRYPVLVLRLLSAPPPDVYLVSYPGWFDMPIVKLIAVLKRRPVLFDPFISLHDTMISDRHLYDERSLVARMARLIDSMSLRLADHLLADTPGHLDLYESLASGSKERGTIVPLGADDEVFTPSPGSSVDERLVEFHGTFVPLQGVETVALAANEVAGLGIQTIIVGDGQDRILLDRALVGSDVQKVQLLGRLPLEELPAQIARATVCLGIFGTSDKADRVIPHKLYECIAMGRPVITRRSAAVAAMFGPDELVVVEPGNPTALASAILDLISDPKRREEIARAGHDAYVSRFHEVPLSRLLEEALGRATYRTRVRSSP